MLGFSGEPEGEKEVYFYDNKGNRVIFDYSIYEDFIRLQSEQTKEADLDKVPQVWKDFGEELKEQSIKSIKETDSTDIDIGLKVVRRATDDEKEKLLKQRKEESNRKINKKMNINKNR